MADKTPHLRDLFVTGKPVQIEIVDPEDPSGPPQVIDLWLRKPSVQQYEEASNKARGKQARMRARFRDPESDEYMVIADQIGEITNKDDLVTQIVMFESQKLRNQAYQEALYGDADEDEPRWGKEGADYLDVLTGMRERYDEIDRFNSELAPGDDNLYINIEDDEELARLNAILDEFAEQQREIQEKLEAKERLQYVNMTMETLRKELAKRLIDLECNLAYFQEYKVMMLYFAARYKEDHSKQYFSSMEELWDMPEFVRTILMSEYDDLEQGDLLKNSRSLQPS